MSPDDKRGTLSTGNVPTDTDTDARSGSGAGTAMQAMLKKRQMHATLETDGETAPDPGQRRQPGD